LERKNSENAFSPKKWMDREIKTGSFKISKKNFNFQKLKKIFQTFSNKKTISKFFSSNLKKGALSNGTIRKCSSRAFQ
jgi:hypothetical protein